MTETTVTLVGNVTRDPELKFTNGGKAVVKFGLAVSRRVRNVQTQEWDERVSFFDVSAWDTLAQNIATSVKKGYRVVVTGSLEQRSWQTESGDKRSAVEVRADAVGPDLRFVTCEIHRTEPHAKAASGEAPEDFF